MLGDFNLIRFIWEKKGSKNSKGTSKEFNEFITSLQLVDVRLNHKSFTWTNNQNNPMLVRIDRWLVSLEWMSAFPLFALFALPRTSSDHCLLILWHSLPITRSKVFRFKNFWYTADNFDEHIESWWNGAPMLMDFAANFVQKLSSIRRNLKIWNNNINGNIIRRKKMIMKIIQQLDAQEECNLTDSERSERATLKQTLDSILL